MLLVYSEREREFGQSTRLITCINKCVSGAGVMLLQKRFDGEIPILAFETV